MFRQRCCTHLPSILILISFVILNERHVGCVETNQTKLWIEFNVLHGRNETTTPTSGNKKDDESSYFCVIDFLPNANSSENINEDYLPMNNFTSYNLCKKLNLPSNNRNGYYIFNYSTSCDTKTQLDNFGHSFPHSNGLIFSTTCDLNLKTHFNLTSEYLSQKSFTLSVITDTNLKGLLSYKQVQRLRPDEPKISAFYCMILIFTTAVFCVFVGSYWSGDVRFGFYLETKQKSQRDALVQKDETESKSTKHATDQEAFADLTSGSVMFAVIVTIVVLMSLYFFYKYIVYGFIAIFMIFSAISFSVCLYTVLNLLLPRSITDLALVISPFLCFKRFSLQYICIPLIPLAVALPVTWFMLRHTSPHAWIIQDILCVCFCIFQLRTLRLPSFKICFMLLGGLFIYDIFFVFITPLFTSNGVSIMEYVATGGVSNRGSISEYRCPGEKVEVLPLSIRAPRNIFGINPHNPSEYCLTGGYSLLGLGDIIIPGIMVSYCNAYDLIRNVPYRSYFIVSTLAYALGLVFSYIALITMEIAQPALLYLVPTTVISVLILSLYRKEFRQFWIGPETNLNVKPADEPLHETDSSSASGYKN